jgi:hypothetical protein
MITTGNAKERQAQRKKIYRKCEGCKQFKFMFMYQIHCSDKCKQRAYRQRLKEKLS